MIQNRKPIDQLTPYIPGKTIDAVKKEYQLEEVIKLASNENPYGCSKAAKAAIIASLDNVALYPDGNATKLREKLANVHQLQTNNLIFGAGSDEILNMLASTYIEPLDEAITCVPTFPRYYACITLMGGHLIELPLTKEYTFDIEAILNAVTPKTKMIFICNPNNPTGTIISQKEMESLLSSIPNNILVVLDEAYCEFVNHPDYPNAHALLSQYANLIILRTFSKAYGLASLRVGYGIADADIIEKLNRVRGPFNVTIPALEAAYASLNDEGFLQETIRLNEEVKQYAYEQCNQLGLSYLETYANFIMIEIKIPTMDIFLKLQQKGIIIRPGCLLGMEGWLRVTLGTLNETKSFFSALEELL